MERELKVRASNIDNTLPEHLKKTMPTSIAVTSYIHIHCITVG
jgi:hypothetical protein